MNAPPPDPTPAPPSPPSALAPNGPVLPPPRPLPRAVRWLLKALAVTSLALGIVGAFVPVMPTVPFVLLAAWAAARSSPRLSHWLETHPRMGPMILAWRRGGVVHRRAKWMATLMMAGGALTMSLLVRPWWIPAVAISVMALVALWLWQRPESAPDEPAA